MKILIVSSYLPYPLFSGGHVRLYNILKELAKKHEITLVCEKRKNQTEKDIEEVRKLCKQVITVERKKQWSINNILNSGFSAYPFLLVGHKSKKMRQKIQELLKKEKFDLIHVETFYVMHNVPKTSLPLVLVEHNIEYLVYKRFLNQVPIFLRPILSLDVVKMRFWEEKYWEKATKLVAVSEEEKRIMKRSDAAVVPNGVDTKSFEFRENKNVTNRNEKRILFIGDFKWIQNKDAALWFLNEVWPSLSNKWILQQMEENEKIMLKLWIVGKNIPDSIKKMKRDINIIIDENAPNETPKIFNQADLLIAPIRVGGGTSYKILEAMASGVPVVTTPLGIEGLEAEENKNVLVSNNPKEISNMIISILNNKDLYADLTKSSRKVVEEKYDWRIITKKLEEVYEAAVK